MDQEVRKARIFVRESNSSAETSLIVALITMLLSVMSSLMTFRIISSRETTAEIVILVAAVTIRWHRLSWENQWINVEAAMFKSKSSRIVWMRTQMKIERRWNPIPSTPNRRKIRAEMIHLTNLADFLWRRNFLSWRVNSRKMKIWKTLIN